jgi:hypothetical protein
MRIHMERKVMPKGSFEVLREVILLGSLPRARVTEVTGYKERQARSIVSRLIELELLTTESVRAPLRLRLHIPHEVVSAWFPCIQGMYSVLDCCSERTILRVSEMVWINQPKVTYPMALYPRSLFRNMRCKIGTVWST